MTPLIAMFLTCVLQFEDMGAQADIEALSRRIRQTLGEVDEALLEAVEVDAVTDQVARARRLHLDAIRDIEALIQKLEYSFQNPPPNSSGGGGSPSSSSGGKPQQQPSQPQASDGSQQDSGKAPEPEGSEGPQQQDTQGEQQGAEQPQDGSADSQQKEGAPPPPDEVLPFTREDTDGRWGLLPPKVQEQLNNLHVDDVPDRYRGWLDAYITAMRKLEQR